MLFLRGDKEGSINNAIQKTFREYPRSLYFGFMVSLYALLWALLLIAPGVIKSLSYPMTYFIAVDHPEWSVGECINESMRVMKGNKVRLFLIYLAFCGLAFLSILIKRV